MSLNQKRKREDKFSKSLDYIPIKKLKKGENLIIEIKLHKSYDSKKTNKSKNSSKNKSNLLKRKKGKKPMSLLMPEEKSIDLHTIEELHKQALDEFNKCKDNAKINYKMILNNVIKIYDLDENINEFLLIKMRDYYEKNKDTIDQYKDRVSNSIAKLFFNYVFTLGHDKREKIFKLYNNYFKEKELFFPEEIKFFNANPLDIVFKKFIKELFDISLTIKQDSTKKSKIEYENDLKQLFANYQFPDFSFKIPIKFANKELIYLQFILHIKKFLCVEISNNNDIEMKKFYAYEITKRFLAFNYYEEYFSKETYDILSIQYIIFSLFTFFLYCDKDEDFFDLNIQSKMFLCSRFLYQNMQEKIMYLKEMKKYIKNEINIDNLNEDYLLKNLLLIQYNEKQIKIDVNQCYILGDKNEYMTDLINNNAFSFDYLRQFQFPFSLDKNLDNDYNSFVREILQSNITTEYVNNLKNIPMSNNTIFTDKIIQEIKTNTFWVKFPVKRTHGVTIRDTFTIFLNNHIEYYDKNKYSNILASKVITPAHENINHMLRLILSINGFHISKKTPKSGEIYKNKQFNNIKNRYYDQGDMWEHIIFGEKINNIFLMGSLIVLDNNNYKLSIQEFKKKFQDNNQRKSIKQINRNIKEIKKNKNNNLIQYINEFNEKEASEDIWLKDYQYITARNNSDFNLGDSQYIYFGICGNHGGYF